MINDIVDKSVCIRFNKTDSVYHFCQIFDIYYDFSDFVGKFTDEIDEEIIYDEYDCIYFKLYSKDNKILLGFVMEREYKYIIEVKTIIRDHKINILKRKIK